MIPNQWRRITAAYRSLPAAGMVGSTAVTPGTAEWVHATAARDSSHPLARQLRAVQIRARRMWWHQRGAQRHLNSVDPDVFERYANATGVTPSEQRRVLSRLVREYGIPVRDAYHFGLVSEANEHAWAEYIFSGESRWNLVASQVVFHARENSRAALSSLADKWATAAILQRSGLPTVPSLHHDADSSVTPTVVQSWLDHWPEVFVKPRFGSAGRDAFVVSPGPTVTRYSQRDPIAIDVGLLQRHMRGQPFLVQPLLAPISAGPSGDITTIRIVTRDQGEGPAVFSTVIEMPPEPARMGHPQFGVTSAGAVHGPIRPGWLPPAESTQPPPEIAIRTAHSAAHEAILAHQSMGPVYAIAWDIAVTPTGHMFLEGNTSFSCLVPQLVSGGLLKGLVAG